MTAELHTWDPDQKSKTDLQREVAPLLYDTIPIRKGGEIVGLLYAASGEETPLTADFLISRDTPIPDALKLLSDSNHPSFLVLFGQKIVGIVTPSDFNKIMARSYFYNVLAMLEMVLADNARYYFREDNDLLLEILRPDHKTRAQFRRDVLERSSGAERSKFSLDLIHSLMLSEFEKLVCKDAGFCTYLGFNGSGQFAEMFDGINDLRRKVMHPTRPLLNDEHGIEELNDRVGRVIALLNFLAAK